VDLIRELLSEPGKTRWIVGKKILIIEDSKENRLLLRDILVFAGYEVFEAENGALGVSMAKELLPELIFMDIQMPVMDGLTALQHLREMPETSDIKAVALTSFAMKGDRERFLAAGFDDYLSKPAHPDDLLGMAKKYLG
jgi:two-component system cell cycle response regulator DivK